MLEFFGVGFFGGEGVFGVAEFFFLIFIGVQLLYNVVLVSAIQQSESVYIYPLFVSFPSYLGHHRALSRVPCAVQ